MKPDTLRQRVERHTLGSTMHEQWTPIKFLWDSRVLCGHLKWFGYELVFQTTARPFIYQFTLRRSRLHFRNRVIYAPEEDLKFQDYPWITEVECFGYPFGFEQSFFPRKVG